MDERFYRIWMMLGDEAMERLSKATVAVIGVGAVGGQALESLARSGVGRIRVVDFDEVRRTNINRQILALESTIGRPKAELAAERILDINPNCKVEVKKLFVSDDTIPEILAGDLDFVIDAIDSLNPKCKLIKALTESRIPFISSMGAARLMDPSKITVGPFLSATRCPLAIAVRKRLHSFKASTEFQCVFSSEGPSQSQNSISEPEEDFYKRGRDRRPLGSLPVITSIFGLLAANAAINHITNSRD